MPLLTFEVKYYFLKMTALLMLSFRESFIKIRFIQKISKKKWTLLAFTESFIQFFHSSRIPLLSIYFVGCRRT